MITNETVVNFIRENVENKRDSSLKAMEEFALENHIPIIQKEASDVLLFFVKLIKPDKILELGTAMGYSSILMARACQESYIDTLERNQDMVTLAKKNIESFSLSDRINVIEGEIPEIMGTLKGQYDLIFIDAGKSHYSKYFNDGIKLLSKNGIIICDNILINGDVALKEIENKKHATSINKMKNFIKEVNEHKDYDSVILPVGDGILVIKRKEI